MENVVDVSDVGSDRVVEVGSQGFSNFAGDSVLRYHRMIEQREAQKNAMDKNIARDTELRSQKRSTHGIYAAH